MRSVWTQLNRIVCSESHDLTHRLEPRAGIIMCNFCDKTLSELQAYHRLEGPLTEGIRRERE